MALTIKEIAENYTLECIEYIEYLAGGPEHVGALVYQINENLTAEFMSEICKVCFMHKQSPRFAALVIFATFIEWNRLSVLNGVKH